ncbi:hypothetical protein [Thiocapsa rosea]|uniref:Uncharacterized protein n=1 Tax=Thiocapsa rosea TaxID=69360 RepID=A0A495UKR0_9GAMM|nr:hypothetical protein [Thiocapsa rosea]RKT37882.1 hypothetical protein BDD21_5393 [Thiocapsa rosea]
MPNETEIPFKRRIRDARRLAWRAGFEEAMRTVEVNLALLLILAEQQAELNPPGADEHVRARQRLSDLTQAFAVITSNPVDRMDDRARLGGALAGAVEQILAPLRTSGSDTRSDRNMEGAEDLVNAVLMGLQLWPNCWGQDVAAAAWLLTDEGTQRCFRSRASEYGHLP